MILYIVIWLIGAVIAYRIVRSLDYPADTWATVLLRGIIALAFNWPLVITIGILLFALKVGEFFGKPPKWL